MYIMHCMAKKSFKDSLMVSSISRFSNILSFVLPNETALHITHSQLEQ